MLIADDPRLIAGLLRQADAARKKFMGDAVHVRGVIEFSSYCRRNCLYCGLRCANRHLRRYRMSSGEIYAAARHAVALGIKTVVLQSGEDSRYGGKEFCLLLERIKKLGLAITLSMGELAYRRYNELKSAGADRYLLRFETSDPALYAHLRPGCRLKERLRCLGWLDKLGYQVGSGAMVGLPGQTAGSIADDVFLFKELNLDMVGIGPFIPHPHTPLAKAAGGSLELALKTVALTRIATKNTHIPATTAVGTIDSQGRQKALRCGANILMPNLTPAKYQKLYEIYPDKICIAADAVDATRRILASLGRSIADGYGHSLKRK